jgi:glycosyltransferase involved in cell wall biosynthesis
MVKQRNDNAFMLIRLQDKGARLAVIAGRSLGLKGEGQLPSYENMDGIPIYRLYEDLKDIFLFPGRHFKQTLQIAQELKPDLIFCSQELNIRLALMLQKHLNVPIVLLVEEAGRISLGEKYSGFKMNTLMRIFGIPTGLKFWKWLCSKALMVITCDPGDQQILDRLAQSGATVSFLPWPTKVPPDFTYPPSKCKHRGVYVGSLSPIKNTQEFDWTLPRILEETPTKEFVVVGPGPHSGILKKLEKKTSGSVKYIPQLSRTEALQLIASSYYAYSPVINGGWGFIGDCWSVGTPIVMTHHNSYVTNDVNALVAENVVDLVRKVNRLYDEPDLYMELEQKCREEGEARKAETVGDALFDLLTKAIEIARAI